MCATTYCFARSWRKAVLVASVSCKFELPTARTLITALSCPQASSVHVCWGSFHVARRPFGQRRTSPTPLPALWSQVQTNTLLFPCCFNNVPMWHFRLIHLSFNLYYNLRTPEPGHHSFAGVAAISSPPLKPPRSQTEVLNYRDRTVGGAQDASRRGSQTKDWEREKEWSQHGRFGSVDRSPEETASLREQLCHVFTGQDNTVALVLQCHPAETDIHVLSDLILERQTD